MAEYVERQKLSDDDIRRCLIAPRGTDWESLAAELGTSPGYLFNIRGRSSKRVLRIARELGLPSRVKYAWMEGWE